MTTRLAAGTLAVMAIALLTSSAAAAELDLTDGMWEVNGRVKMEGLPIQMPAVPVSFTQCITKKDAIPQQKEGNKDCKITSQRIEGSTVTWAALCVDKNGAKTEGTGTVTYKGASFEGKVNNVTTDPRGARMTSRMEMAGKRTGDCK